MLQTAKFDANAFYERLLAFGQNCQRLVTHLPNTEYNKIYSIQLIRSSSSPGANYIEALEALSRKDFIYRLKICRKETRESVHWLRLISEANPSSDVSARYQDLINEGIGVIRILTSSILTSEKTKS